MDGNPLPEGRLVEKSSVLVRARANDVDNILHIIEGSNGILGGYGNYDCVVSTYPLHDPGQIGMWTFCNYENRAHAYELLAGKYRPTIDFARGRVWMPADQEAGKTELTKEQARGEVGVFIDVPFGDIGRTKDRFSELSEGLIGVGRELFVFYRGRGYLYSWPRPEEFATGYFKPLEGSHPHAGSVGKVREVKYRKLAFLLSYDVPPEGPAMEIEDGIERMIVTEARKTIDYELPVIFIPEKVARATNPLFDVPMKFESRFGIVDDQAGKG